MNGAHPIVQTEHVDEQMARVYISVTIPARYVDYGQLPLQQLAQHHLFG
jgi:hypothetical protein